MPTLKVNKFNKYIFIIYRQGGKYKVATRFLLLIVKH